MEFDFNSSINLNSSPKIPRSRSSAQKYEDVGFKIDKRVDLNNDFKNILITPSKLNQESKIQTRPLIDIEIGKSAKKIIKTVSDKKLTLADEREFDFDHVYSDSTTNSEVFEKSVKSNITRALEGYNFSIMAYGQTGSGKTYTVGTNQSKTQTDKEINFNKGIIQQSIEYIFKSIKNKSNISPIKSHRNLLEESNSIANVIPDSSKYTNTMNNSFTHDFDNFKYEYIIKASFVEIYNEEIIDLLNIKTPSKHIIIRNLNNLTTLSGVSLINVNEPEDCYQLLNTGISNRKTSSTNMNEKSSRSHAIFTLYFEKLCISQTLNESGTGFNNLNPNNIPINFKINFIDLAGSERIKKSGATGERFKESVSINSGLLALSKVIMALSENNSKLHIPYRDSKLTRILKDSLNGASITLILACVSPSDSNYEETLNTLNYASFAKTIKVNPLINFTVGNIGVTGNNVKYEEIINKLKNENFLLMKQVEDLRNCENKEIEIVRLKNVIKTLKRKMILKNDPAANYREISSKNANDFKLIDTDDEIKMSEIDKDSFLKISELMDEEENLDDDIKEKFNDEQDNRFNNKNEYEYIVRIKENNILKRENEELREQLNKLLNEQSKMKNKLTISPSYINLDNVENDINSKLLDFNNLIDLNNINKDGLENPDYKPTKKSDMDTEISIKDLKAMEIDENKLEEESNFLLNCDNDLIIAQLSESLVNKRERENIDNNINNDIFNRENITGFKDEINQVNGPVFNSKQINNSEDENVQEDDLIDVNKSIKFNNHNSLKKFNDEMKINSNNDLKSMISKEKMNKYSKARNHSDAPINKKNDIKIPSYKYNNNRNVNFVNTNRITSSVNSNNSINRKSSKIQNSSLTKNDKIKFNYSSNSNISSINCSQEKSNYKQIENNNNKHSINIKASMYNSMYSKISPNRKFINQNTIFNKTMNNTTLNTSNISEVNKLRLQQNISLISQKIAQLRDYQRKLKEKIIEAEVEKNKILKNKNEQISYMKRNVNDKQRILKNLQVLNDRNQKIIERSEQTIKNLKIELRHKSMEIRSIQKDNSTSKSVNFGNPNNFRNNNSSFRNSFVFSGWNKFGKDTSGGCCGGASHNKNLSHSMNNKASNYSLNKSRKFGLDAFKDEMKASQKSFQPAQAFSPCLNRSNTNNMFSYKSRGKDIENLDKLIYPDTSKENLFKTPEIFSKQTKNTELNTTKCVDLVKNNNNKNKPYETKNKIENENFNDDKKIVNTLKFILLDLEKLFLEKNKCQKRMKNLQNDKKEIIQLKKQNLERYNSRLKALINAKNRLENTLKQEENNNHNSSGGIKGHNSNYPKLNIISNNENNNNTNLSSYSNSYIPSTTTPDVPSRSICEKKTEYNTTGSAGNLKDALIINDVLNSFPNSNVNDKSFKLNANTGNIKIENINNSTSISNSKEKYLTANTNNYNQNIQKLTAIIYKISAVNERIERMNNLHESTLSEINLSEDILIKQMKNIKASINRIKMQLSNSDYHSAKKDFDDSIEDLRKELLDNNYVTLSNNNNNNNLNKNENPFTVENNTECNEIENTTNNSVANMISNLNTNMNFIDNNLSLNAENTKKIEKVFEKMYEMKRLLEHKNRKLNYIETENSNKEKLIQDLQRKIENNLNKGYLFKQNSDDTSLYLNRNKNSFKIDNNKIKDEDYYCNFGKEKDITLEKSGSKKDSIDNQLERGNKNNSNYVNISNTIYNISLTPQKIKDLNTHSEKKPWSTQKYKLPPTNKKKY